MRHSNIKFVCDFLMRYFDETFSCKILMRQFDKYFRGNFDGYILKKNILKSYVDEKF